MSPGIVAESDLTGSLTSEYVFFDGERVARKDFPSNAVSYYFSDHLKTASVITDSAGNIKEDEDYFPYGGEVKFVDNDPNHYKFTGKERDTESGLDYFGARYYGNALGRFMTPDTPFADQHAADPQSWNLYAYVRNNPTSDTDQDGHAKCTTNQKTGTSTCQVWAHKKESLSWYDFAGWWWVGFANLATTHPGKGASQMAYGYVGNAATGAVIGKVIGSTGKLVTGLVPKLLPKGARLALVFEKLAALPKAGSAAEAVEQMNSTLEQVEDAHSGVPADPNPPRAATERMYAPKADSMTNNADGSITAKTFRQTVTYGQDGSITVVNNKSGEVIFHKD
jgi:RHS repeat-associated protein